MAVARSMGDAISELRKEGLANANHDRLKHAIRVGSVDRPALDNPRRYRIVERDMNQFRHYLKNVPSRGPRPVS